MKESVDRCSHKCLVGEGESPCNISNTRATTDDNCEQWTDTDSREFLSYQWAFVPERQFQHWAILSLIPVDKKLQIVDLCCGTGSMSAEILRTRPYVRLRALDRSHLMLAAAKANFREFGDRGVVEEFDLLEVSPDVIGSEIDIVISSLAVHHLSNDDKQQLFRTIFHSLTAGGKFILADLFMPTTEEGRRIAAESWNNCVKAQSLESLNDLSAFEQFVKLDWNNFCELETDNVDKPGHIFDQLSWLASAGFVMIDVHWVRAGHFLISAVKP